MSIVLRAGETVPDTWEVHYGLRVSFIGEDGDMVIAGHHDEMRCVAALNRFYRGYVGESLNAGVYSYEEIANGLSRRWVRFITTCDDADLPEHRTEACIRCSEIRQADWWMDYAAREPAPGLLAMTLWGPA